ncbi:hypothetical protein M0Q28_03035 [Patescibacteria group bacterium]|jgi:hypothetical protein|nr:hypothetical protein [Patescibacteria group bacterium]
MQGNARLLHKTNIFSVQTKHDKKRIEAASVSGHRVLVGLREERFYDIVKGKEIEITYPAGTGYLWNGKQGLYQVFLDGMYTMLRSKAHTARGERFDSQDMRGMKQLTFDFLCRLRTWTQIGDEGQVFTDNSLRELADWLDHPKRDEHKLTASERFRKASELRTQANQKRMPMPAAFTAAAGAQQLELRRAVVEEILRWVDPERRHAFALVEGVHARLDDAWRVFSPEALDQPGHTVVLASRKPTEQSIKVMRDYLRPVYRGLREIKVRPLNGLADEAAVSLATLRDKIMNASGPADITAEIAAIREPLTVMRVVRELEMGVITPLSMVLNRWKRLETRKHPLARERAADACLHFGTDVQFHLGYLQPKQGASIMEHVRDASLIAAKADEDPRKQLLQVKKVLKRLSATLT